MTHRDPEVAPGPHKAATATTATWTVAVEVPANLPDNLKDSLFTAIADTAHTWEPEHRDGWDVSVGGHPTAHTPNPPAGPEPASAGLRDPIARRATRWLCPFCTRGHWAKAKATEHIARCWKNPATRSCKTCTHYQPSETGESCFPGRPCPCNNTPEACNAHDGPDLEDGGIRTACPLWEALG